MLLADHGARVIKVEKPNGGDDVRGWGPPFIGDDSSAFVQLNRNKEIPKPKQKSEEIKKETQVWFDSIKSINVGSNIKILNAMSRVPNTLSINLKLNIIH